MASFSNDAVVVIDTSTDEVVGPPIAVGDAPVSIAVTSSKAYVVNSQDESVSVITTSSDIVTDTITVGNAPSAVAVTPDGITAYVTNNVDSTVSVIDTASDTVSGTLSVGPAPSAVAVSPDGTRAFVANGANGTVSSIVVSSGAVNGVYTVGNQPSGIAVTASKIYVSNQGSDTVSVVDVGLVVPVGDGPYAVAFTPDSAKAYVANNTAGTVSVMNVLTGSVTSTVTVGTNPSGIAVTPDGDKAYVVNQGDSNVSVIDTSTDTVVESISVGVAPNAVVVTPDGTKAYVTNYLDDTVSVIDTALDVVIATIPVGALPQGIAVTPNGTKVYVTNHNGDSVSVISVEFDVVMTTIPVGTTPVGVAVSPDGTKAYVTNYNDSTVSVIDTGPDTVITAHPVGSHPFGVAFAPVNAKAYVTNLADSNVSVIETVNDIAIDALPAGSGPYAVAVSPDGMHAYVTNYNDDNVTILTIAPIVTDENITVSGGAEYDSSVIAFEPMTLTADAETAVFETNGYGTGTEDEIQDEGITTQIDMPFDFTFFGEVYDRLFASTNGFLSFLGNDCEDDCYSPTDLPDDDVPNGMIAGYWGDLCIGSGGDSCNGTVKYQTFGDAPNRVFVVEFRDISMCCDNTSDVTYQAQLHETTNAIEIHTTIAKPDRDITQGIESASGTVGYALAGRKETEIRLRNDAVRFSPHTGPVTFKVGDTITVTWDNSVAGDNTGDLDMVTVDFTDWDGSSIADMTDTTDCGGTPGDGVYEACHVVPHNPGGIDTEEARVSVTATIVGGDRTRTVDSGFFTVDDVRPVTNEEYLSVSGATGTPAVFTTGDTVTVTWDNSGAGDDNDDLASVFADLFMWGGSSLVEMTDTTACDGDAGDDIYEACQVIPDAHVGTDTDEAQAAILVFDDLGNMDHLIADATSTVNFVNAPGGGHTPEPAIVSVVQPNGGEILTHGETYNVVWSSGGEGISSYSLCYSTDSGATWSTCTTGITGNSHPWGPQNLGSAHMRIRINALESTGSIVASDESDKDFTVIAQTSGGGSSGGGGGTPSTDLSKGTQGSQVGGSSSEGAFTRPVAETHLPPTIDVDYLVKLADDGNPATWSDSTVYYIGLDAKRHPFMSAAAYLSWYQDFSGVRIVDNPLLASIPLGKPILVRPGTHWVKIQSDPKTYYVEPGYKLRWIQDEASALKLGGPDWNKDIIDVDVSMFVLFSAGPVIDVPYLENHLPAGTLVDSALNLLDDGLTTYKYYITSVSHRAFNPDSAFVANGFQQRWVWDSRSQVWDSRSQVWNALRTSLPAGPDITGREDELFSLMH